jgi:hypothetical protein
LLRDNAHSLHLGYRNFFQYRQSKFSFWPENGNHIQIHTTKSFLFNNKFNFHNGLQIVKKVSQLKLWRYFVGSRHTLPENNWVMDEVNLIFIVTVKFR